MEKSKTTRWRVLFFDKHGDETRSIVVEAGSEEEAEASGAAEADRRGWSQSFKVAEAEEIG